jgi:hypothetical protein
MGQTFRENSWQNIDQKKFEENFEKIFGKKDKKNEKETRIIFLKDKITKLEKELNEAIQELSEL